MISKAKYKMNSCGCFWLSETPHLAGSQSWGTARARHPNWVRLKDIAFHKEFRIINIHLEHISQSAREAQTQQVMEEGGQYLNNFQQLLAGDFNTGPANKVIVMTKEGGWTDAYSHLIFQKLKIK